MSALSELSGLVETTWSHDPQINKIAKRIVRAAVEEVTQLLEVANDSQDRPVRAQADCGGLPSSELSQHLFDVSSNRPIRANVGQLQGLNTHGSRNGN